jgi:hypothetical protein
VGPTYGRVVPWSDDGARRLAVELERADEVLEQPALVWLFDSEVLEQLRGTLYAWRHTPLRQALVVWRPDRVERVAWVCEPFVRARHE